MNDDLCPYCGGDWTECSCCMVEGHDVDPSAEIGISVVGEYRGYGDGSTVMQPIFQYEVHAT